LYTLLGPWEENQKERHLSAEITEIETLFMSAELAGEQIEVALIRTPFQYRENILLSNESKNT